MSTAYKFSILVVDDDDDVRFYICCLLEKENYVVISAENGERALELLSRKHPDLILMDVEMPGMDGFELCSKIRQDILLKKVPVIFLTGSKKNVEDRVHGLEVGSDDYLLKPFDSSELLARIKNLLLRSGVYLDSNPLTHLSGNGYILRELQYRLDYGQKFACLYCDLNHFKAFNDRYGFLKGDEVLRFTARVLVESVQLFGCGTDFVGHIGGDDFIVVTTCPIPDVLCADIVQRFERQVREFYSPEDINRGGIELPDRKGQLRKFPIMGIAIAGVTNAYRPLRSVEEISAISADLKKYVKSFEFSAFIVDRRKSTVSETESKVFSQEAQS